MSIEEIKQLILLAREQGVAELELERGEDRVRIKLPGFSAEVMHQMVPAPGVQAVWTPPPSVAEAKADPKTDPKATLVNSPIVGTFYSAPSPGAPSFVKVGDTVRQGQVLCIIESMKLMNEIESEVSGTVTAMLVENGNAVEYGEALFAIRTA
jgi:acetyl-CoA carboxylase biotin carboxyl carrier protein